MSSLLLPDWFNPYGWAGLAGLVIILLLVIIILILHSGKKKQALEDEGNSSSGVAKKKKAKPVEDDDEEEEEVKKEKTSVKTYHISKRKDDNRWQVKAAGAEKALKLFNTQAEAIEYAKSVAGNQDAYIMIHKEDGSFRKLKY